MTVSEYFDDEPEEEIDIDSLRKKIYADFMDNLQIIANTVRIFPAEWQLDILLGMMEDI